MPTIAHGETSCCGLKPQLDEPETLTFSLRQSTYTMKHLEKFTKLFVQGKTSRALLVSWARTQPDITKPADWFTDILLKLSRRAGFLKASTVLLVTSLILAGVHDTLKSDSGADNLYIAFSVLCLLESTLAFAFYVACRAEAAEANQFIKDTEALYEKCLRPYGPFKTEHIGDLQHVSTCVEGTLVLYAKRIVTAENEGRATNHDTEEDRRRFGEAHRAALPFGTLVSETYDPYFTRARTELLVEITEANESCT